MGDVRPGGSFEWVSATPELLSLSIREEQCETCRGDQTTQKANKYLGDFWTSQPEQVLTLSLMKYPCEVSSEAQISLRCSRYSGPHLAPRTAPLQGRGRKSAKTRGMFLEFLRRFPFSSVCSQKDFRSVLPFAPI